MNETISKIAILSETVELHVIPFQGKCHISIKYHGVVINKSKEMCIHSTYSSCYSKNGYKVMYLPNDWPKMQVTSSPRVQIASRLNENWAVTNRVNWGPSGSQLKRDRKLMRLNLKLIPQTPYRRLTIWRQPHLLRKCIDDSIFYKILTTPSCHPITNTINSNNCTIYATGLITFPVEIMTTSKSTRDTKIEIAIFNYYQILLATGWKCETLRKATIWSRRVQKKL